MKVRKIIVGFVVASCILGGALAYSWTTHCADCVTASCDGTYEIQDECQGQPTGCSNGPMNSCAGQCDEYCEDGPTLPFCLVTGSYQDTCTFTGGDSECGDVFEANCSGFWSNLCDCDPVDPPNNLGTCYADTCSG
ncbi:hypothetical protein ACFL3G_05580 [Planctomycetota bacterium]